MRKTAKIATAAAIAGLVFAGGSAFTAGNTQAADSTVGYGSTTVSGATVESLTYTTNLPGSTITSATLVLDGDTTGSNVQMAYNDGNLFDCGEGTPTGTPVTSTSYTCTATQATSGLTATHVLVN